jgi:hypothetical protein
MASFAEAVRENDVLVDAYTGWKEQILFFVQSSALLLVFQKLNFSHFPSTVFQYFFIFYRCAQSPKSKIQFTDLSLEINQIDSRNSFDINWFLRFKSEIPAF